MEFSLYIYIKKSKSTQNWKVFWTRIDEMGNIFHFAFTKYLNNKNGSYWIPEKVPAFPQQIIAWSLFSHLCEHTALSERRPFFKNKQMLIVFCILHRCQILHLEWPHAHFKPRLLRVPNPSPFSEEDASRILASVSAQPFTMGTGSEIVWLFFLFGFYS